MKEARDYTQTLASNTTEKTYTNVSTPELITQATLPKKWKVIFRVKAWPYYDWWNIFLNIYRWASVSTDKVEYSFNTSPYVVKEQEYKTDNRSAWDIFSIYGGAGWSQTTNRMKFYRAYIDLVLCEFQATNDWFIRPILLKDLWQTTTWTIYWKHIDNTYYWWIMIEKSETATTWSITPWNFQWYITTNFNWEIIKIPYYL